MNFGSSLHFAVQAYHEGGDPHSVFVKSWKGFCVFMAAHAIPFSDYSTARGLDLLELYLANPMPEGKAEVSSMVRLPGVAVPIRLVLDLVYDDGQRIGELKTAQWPWKPGRAADEFQMKLYEACLPLVTGKQYVGGTYTILSLSPSLKLTRVELEPRAGIVNEVAGICSTVLADMAAGVWTPKCPPVSCKYSGESFCPLLRATATREGHPQRTGLMRVPLEAR